MMSVAEVYETGMVECTNCGGRWVAVIPTPMITWPDGTSEVRIVEELECPECLTISQIKRIDDEQTDQ